MVLDDLSQTFHFTFRTNGEAHGLRLTEVHVQQLAGYNVSSKEGAYKRDWYGNEDSLKPMLASLGFDTLDIDGVIAALASHSGTDRNFAVTPDQLHEAGFQQSA